MEKPDHRTGRNLVVNNKIQKYSPYILKLSLYLRFTLYQIFFSNTVDNFKSFITNVDYISVSFIHAVVIFLAKNV